MRRPLLVCLSLFFFAVLSHGQERCTCANIETQEIRTCSAEGCFGEIAIVGCDTIHAQDSCMNCQRGTATCCGRFFPSATSTGPCHFNSDRLTKDDLYLLASASEDIRVLVPNCAGGFIPLKRMSRKRPS